MASIFSWSDYEMVLKLNPGNEEALCEVKKIKEVSLKETFKTSRSSLKLSFPELSFVPCLF